MTTRRFANNEGIAIGMILFIIAILAVIAIAMSAGNNTVSATITPDRVTADERMVMKLPSAPAPSSQARAGRLKNAQDGLSTNAAATDSTTANAQQAMNARVPPSQ